MAKADTSGFKPKQHPRDKNGRFKTGGHAWKTAAIVTGVGAVGTIATAALMALRGDIPIDLGFGDDIGDLGAGAAHQADGADSSASFAAGIADEGTIPV